MSGAVPPGTPIFAEAATAGPGRPVETKPGDSVSGMEGEPIPHMVSTAPFDPMSVERLSPEQERFYLASQWRMMWWRFRRHRLAVFAGVLAV